MSWEPQTPLSAGSSFFSYASFALRSEARSLLHRLGRLRPYALQEPMVPAAALSPGAQGAIESFVRKEREQLWNDMYRFLDWLASKEGQEATPAEAQRRLVLLRLRFNAVLTHADVFSEALSQRSEADTGVFLAGLDTVARDALVLPGYLSPPPVVCYLARGAGAAIRRVHTRLPGGGWSPVALIRMPRERMIGSGLSSSLFHEVGHQGAALLDLTDSFRQVVRQHPRREGQHALCWQLWERWISEVVADFWALSRLGVVATSGLMSVVTIPRAFVFRENFDDPHPTPWIRVLLSCALGDVLYPHPQWKRLRRLWMELYPTSSLEARRIAHLRALDATLPALVDLLIRHRPRRLGYRTLPEVMQTAERQPERLRALYRMWRVLPSRMRKQPPSLVFSVLGQGRADGLLDPDDEGEMLSRLLRHWALTSALQGTRRQP